MKNRLYTVKHEEEKQKMVKNVVKKLSKFRPIGKSDDRPSRERFFDSCSGKRLTGSTSYVSNFAKVGSSHVLHYAFAQYVRKYQLRK